MMRRSNRVGGMGAALLFALTTGTVPAWAHGDPPGDSQSHATYKHPPPIRGLVTSLGNSSLKVQTSAGSVTVALTGSTKVARVVTGTTADLRTGQFIDAQFASGTATIRSIRIDAAQGHEPPPNWNASGRQAGGRSHSGGSSGTGSRQSAPPKARTGVEGQIMSLTGSSVTVRGHHGQNTTYPLSGVVTVTKVVAGKIADLATGETVQVCPNRGTTAAFITILSS